MTASDPLGELWRRVDLPRDERPTWRNTPSITGFRSYTNDAVLRVSGDVLRLDVARWLRRFVVVFAALFLPTFGAIAWFTIPRPPDRFLFAIGGPIIGAVVFAIMFGICTYHGGLGAYLIIDRAAKTIHLPRLKKEFSFSHVAFQWIRGRTKSNPDVEVDLNLLVSESGDVFRYHVMGSPSRRIIEQVVCFSGLPLEEIDLGRRGNRDVDRESHGR